MSQDDCLSAARCAELVAPALDRLRLALAGMAMGRMPEVAASLGLDQPAVLMAAYLRNTYPERAFSRTGALTVFLYQGGEVASSGLDSLIALGHLEQAGGGALRLSATGRDVLRVVLSTAESTAQELWARDEATVLKLLPLAEAAVAAVDDGGEAYAVMVPPVSAPEGTAPFVRLGELLAGLRFHRFDGHIAAWRAAGLSLEQVTALPDGELRDAIERDTNERAATPYRALSSDERLQFLAGLAALHG